MNFIKKYLHIFIASLIAILICVGVVVYENKAWNGVLHPIRLWCDGTFISGALILGVGGLSFISQHGGFDALRYAFIKFVDKFKNPRYENRSDEQTYYDYVKEKHSEKKRPVAYLLIIGALLIVISIVLAFFAPDAPLE